MAGASTIAWSEPSVATITLAHGREQLSPLCVEEDEHHEKDTDHGPDSEGHHEHSDDSDSRDSSQDCDDSDDSKDDD